MSSSATYKPELVNGVWQFPIDRRLSQKAERYGKLRKKEGRILDDDVVANLPQMDAAHPLATEFDMREKSVERISKCFEKTNVHNILEIGCGNGWLLANLVRGRNVKATGIDIFLPELEQASRVFGHLPIDWVRGDVFQAILPPASFEVVIIANTAQYFKNLNSLINRAKGLVRNGGLIHIMDTPFYHKRKIKKATEHTYDYYASLDMPWMTGQYFHHTFKALNGNKYELLHNPNSIENRVKRLLNRSVAPYPHVQIRKAK